MTLPSAPGPTTDPSLTAVRDWAMIAHLSALVGLLGNGIGFVLGPLVVWLWKRDDHEFIREQAIEALNFQITMMLAVVAGVVLAFTLVMLVPGFLVIIAAGLMMVIYPIVAATQAKRGMHYRYPLSLRLVK